MASRSRASCVFKTESNLSSVQELSVCLAPIRATSSAARLGYGRGRRSERKGGFDAWDDAVSVRADDRGAGPTGGALAVPPTLRAVGQENRHPTASFSAPRADTGTIYIATKPDRATDGSFLDENVKTLDSLTDSELQGGGG
jgi:hypothetical protein